MHFAAGGKRTEPRPCESTTILSGRVTGETRSRSPGSVLWKSQGLAGKTTAASEENKQAGRGSSLDSHHFIFTLLEINEAIQHSFTQSFIHSFTQSFIHPIIHSLNHSSIQHSFIHSINHSFIHSIIHPLNVHSFNDLFPSI